MAHGQALREAARSTASKAVVGLILVTGLSHAACGLGEVFYTVVRMALRALPSVAQVAWQALEGAGCEHPELWQAWVHASACCSTALRNLTGVV